MNILTSGSLMVLFVGVFGGAMLVLLLAAVLLSERHDPLRKPWDPWDPEN